MTSSTFINNYNNHYQYNIPSTPIYSEMSGEHNIIKYPLNVPRREDRSLVLVLTSVTFFIQVSEIVIIAVIFITQYLNSYQLKLCI